MPNKLFLRTVWSPVSLKHQIFNVTNPKYIIGVYSRLDVTSPRLRQLFFAKPVYCLLSSHVCRGFTGHLLFCGACYALLAISTLHRISDCSDCEC